jgi:hypothetical protein
MNVEEISSSEAMVNVGITTFSDVNSTGQSLEV